MALYQNVGGTIKTLAGDGGMSNAYTGSCSFKTNVVTTSTIRTTSLPKFILLWIQNGSTSGDDSNAVNIACFTTTGTVSSNIAGNNLTVTFSNTGISITNVKTDSSNIGTAVTANYLVVC